MTPDGEEAGGPDPAGPGPGDPPPPSPMDPRELRRKMTASYPEGWSGKLAAASVGIAGAGGLGSVIAISLARACVGRLVIADFDVVEAANLNRQHYFVDQVGLPKVDALAANLARINPSVKVVPYNIRVTRANVVKLFKGVDVLVEAFDLAEQKLMLIEAALLDLPDTPVVAASGLGGYGNNEGICTRRSGRLHICGDMVTEVGEGQPPMAPRVGVVANLQANRVMEIILDGKAGAGKGES